MADPLPPASVLVDAQDQVLSALGLGVIACDAALRVVAATSQARTVLGSLPRPRAPQHLPECLAEVVLEREPGPVRISAAGRAYAVWARPMSAAGASHVVWLQPEDDGDDLDAALRRRWHLTRRQLDLMRELRQGYRNQEIAVHLGLTRSTVKSYLSHLFGVLGVHSRGQAIALIERVRRGG